MIRSGCSGILIVALALVGCGDSENVGRGELALTGEVPSSSADRGDWAYEVWDGEGADVSVLISEIGDDADLVAIDIADFDGDGDLEVDCIAGDVSVSVDEDDVAGEIGSARALLDDLSTDFEDYAGEAAIAGELLAEAEAAASAAAALATIDPCGIDPEATVGLCLAAVEVAAVCAEGSDGRTCAADLAVEVTTAACVASAIGLTEGVVACAERLVSELESLGESLGELGEYGDYPDVPEV